MAKKLHSRALTRPLTKAEFDDALDQVLEACTTAGLHGPEVDEALFEATVAQVLNTFEIHNVEYVRIANEPDRETLASLAYEQIAALTE